MARAAVAVEELRRVRALEGATDGTAAFGGEAGAQPTRLPSNQTKPSYAVAPSMNRNKKHALIGALLLCGRCSIASGTPSTAMR